MSDGQSEACQNQELPIMIEPDPGILHPFYCGTADDGDPPPLPDDLSDGPIMDFTVLMILVFFISFLLLAAYGAAHLVFDVAFIVRLWLTSV